MVKQRLQVQKTGSGVLKYKGSLHGLRTVYSEEGLRFELFFHFKIDLTNFS